MHKLVWVFFCSNCVKLTTFSILHNYAQADVIALRMRPPEYWVHINDFTLSIFYTTHLCRTNDILSCDCYVLYFHLITQLTLEVVFIYRFYPAQMVLEIWLFHLAFPSHTQLTLEVGSTAFSNSHKFEYYSLVSSYIINLIHRNFCIFLIRNISYIMD